MRHARAHTHSGKVLNLGADWGLLDRFGTFHPDTRYHLQTDDGANIFVRTEGPAQTDGTIHLHVHFETGHEDYYWLNNVVAVGVLRAGTGYVVIDTWQVGSFVFLSFSPAPFLSFLTPGLSRIAGEDISS